MVLDSSAIVALVMNEAESPRLRVALEEAVVALVGTPTLFECSVVLTRFLGLKGREFIQDLLVASGIEVVPFTTEHEAEAVDAFLRFGKGRHPAALNYGDCMAYAVAKIAGQPLLFVGSDFSQTDIPAAGQTFTA